MNFAAVSQRLQEKQLQLCNQGVKGMITFSYRIYCLPTYTALEMSLYCLVLAKIGCNIPGTRLS